MLNRRETDETWSWCPSCEPRAGPRGRSRECTVDEPGKYTSNAFLRSYHGYVCRYHDAFTQRFFSQTHATPRETPKDKTVNSKSQQNNDTKQQRSAGGTAAKVCAHKKKQHHHHHHPSRSSALWAQPPLPMGMMCPATVPTDGPGTPCGVSC